MKAMGIVVGSIATITPRTGDFDQAATVAIENKLKKIVYSRSLCKNVCPEAHVKERTRAEC